MLSVYLVEVTKCNHTNGKVAIYATLNHSVGGKSYPEFSTGSAIFDDVSALDKTFLPASGSDPAYLVLTKTLGSDQCEKKTVDGIQVNSFQLIVLFNFQVCVDTAELLTLQCKYPLGDRTISDGFDVTGQDTAASAENTGKISSLCSSM